MPPFQARVLGYRDDLRTARRTMTRTLPTGGRGSIAHFWHGDAAIGIEDDETEATIFATSGQLVRFAERHEGIARRGRDGTAVKEELKARHACVACLIAETRFQNTVRPGS